MKRALLPLFSIYALTSTAAVPQPVSGRIETAAGVGIAYATIALLHEGTQAAGTTSDSLGKFVLHTVPGSYTVQVRHIAYRSFEQPTKVTGQTREIGPFRLTEAATQVGAVVVKATAATREADRFVIRVGDSPALAGKDGAELLSEAPGVWLDDAGIAINGSKGVKVFVNDRELRLDGDRLTTYLRGFRASEIARIEVVPQAGAEYSADARGGVLRIILRKQTVNGMTGSLSATSNQGLYLQNYAPSGNLSARIGKWTLNAAGSGIFTTRGDSHYRESRKYSSDATRYAGLSEIGMRGNYGTGRIGAFCDITPRHSIGAEAEYAAEGRNMPSTARTQIEQTGTQTLADSHYRQYSRQNTLSATANYIWKIDTVGSAFKLLLDYTRQRSTGDNDYNTRFSTGTTVRDTLYRSATSARYAIFSVEAGLDKRFAHKLSLKSGVKYTRNHMNDDAFYEGNAPNGWASKPAYNYTLGYTEQIAAAYATLGAQTGRWNFSAGLRGEYTATDGRGSEVHKSYFSLFPNASVSYALNDMRTWMLAGQYSRNIERPGFGALNPARIQLSDYSYQTGNPALRPTYIDRTSLTLIWKYRYTLTIGGNLHRDLIREVTRTDAQNANVTYVIPENHFVENHWFAALNAPIQLMRNWTLTVNAVGVRQEIRLTRESAVSGHWLLFTNIITGVTLPAKFYAEFSYNGQSRLYSGNSEVAPRHTANATLKKRLCNDRLTLSIAMQNIFDAGVEYNSTTDGMRRSMKGRSGWSSRYGKVGLTWNFRTGREFKTRQVEGAADTERQRLKNSLRE